MCQKYDSDVILMIYGLIISDTIIPKANHSLKDMKFLWSMI